MSRALCLLLLVTMAPRVILPSETRFCICAAIRCVDCGCCAPAKPAEHSCCSRCVAKHAHSVVMSGKSCRGCLRFVQETHPQARPDAPFAARDLAPPPIADACILPAFEVPQIVRLVDWKAIPPPEAPPDLRRALPLLI